MREGAPPSVERGRSVDAGRPGAGRFGSASAADPRAQAAAARGP
jgi:hypothetical protein